MNAPANGKQRPTPQKSSRTVRDLFLSYIQKARKYYAEADEIQKAFSEKSLHFGSERAAIIACSQDIRWQEAVQNEKFMERLANMYGQAALLQELEAQHNTLKAIEANGKKTNELLNRMLAQSND